MYDNIKIRMVEETDAEELLAIYGKYVTDTAITFEYEVPSIEEFRKRIRDIAEKYPYLTAVCGEEIVGYAYASTFKNRDAYNWAVETSIYVKREIQGKGIGKKLYAALEDILKRQNIINLNACISYPNPDSITFHEKMGYHLVAHFNKCGFKLGTWYDMVWMEKMLGEHMEYPDPMIPINKLIEKI